MKTHLLALREVVSIERGTTYKSALLDMPGPMLLGLGSIRRNGGFRADSLRTYGGDSPRKLLVQPGELYASLKDVTQTADLLGSVARVPLDSPVGRLTQDTVRLDLKDTGFSSSYLYWMLRTPGYRHYCRAHATGTTTMGLSREDFFAFSFPAPSAERMNLVALLDMLDDKIAANERTAALVVALATAKFQKAVAGVAVGEQTFSEVADVGGGGTPKTSIEEYWGGAVAWATPTDVTALASPYLAATSRTITEAGLAACSSALYPAGSILMTSRATIGAFAIAQQPTAVNQGFIVVNARDQECQWWLFHEMQDRVPEFLTHANGATFLELSRGRFRELGVRMPPRDVIVQFGDEVGQLHVMAAQIAIENLQLAKTRDELLPLLMSGRLRVKDAESVVGEAV